EGQVANAGEGSAADLFLGQGGEEAFYLVDPGGAGRGEVEVIARVARELAAYAGMLVGAIVVQDEMHVELGADFAVDEAEELQELLVTMAGVAMTDHLAAGDIERREETGDPVAFVVVGASLGMAEPH